MIRNYGEWYVGQIQKIDNIAHINVHKLYQSFVANKERAYNIQMDCSRMVQRRGEIERRYNYVQIRSKKSSSI